jgi:ankyrin repeat protein
MSSSSAVNADGTLKRFPTPEPSNPACIAAFNGDTSVLSSLPRKQLLEQDASSNTPLIWAADQGHHTALELILSVVEKEEPSHINTRGFLGNTAISRAARGGHVECVEALLGASETNPNIANDKVQYPLHFAAFKRHPSVVKALLASPLCDTLVIDRKGRTPAEDTKDEAIRAMILESRLK